MINLRMDFFSAGNMHVTLFYLWISFITYGFCSR